MNIIPKNGDGNQAASETIEQTLSKNAAYAGTPGLQYIAQWLDPNLGDQFDACSICEYINNGRLVACDHCHFLHLNLESAGCDVCAQLPAALRFGDSVDDIIEQLIADGPADLTEARTDRAKALSELLLGGYNCAVALIWGAMGEAIRPLRRDDAPKPDNGDGGAGLRLAA